MSHCHHEHEHTQDHGSHDNHDHSHDHSSDIQPALQSLLYSQIDFQKITTYNETISSSGQAIIRKPWSERLTTTPSLVSDADEQLLLNVPFTGTVKLHSILIRTSDSSSAPQTMHLYSNRSDLDFSTAQDLKPVQTIHLAQTNEVQDVPVKRALFGNVYNLSLFVENNYGEESTELFYLGFKGEFMKLNREPIEVLYEAAANPKDHVLMQGIGQGVGSGIGGR